MCYLLHIINVLPENTDVTFYVGFVQSLMHVVNLPVKSAIILDPILILTVCWSAFLQRWINK